MTSLSNPDRSRREVAEATEVFKRNDLRTGAAGQLYLKVGYACSPNLQVTMVLAHIFRCCINLGVGKVEQTERFLRLQLYYGRGGTEIRRT
jgi:hypothetical protein